MVEHVYKPISQEAETEADPLSSMAGSLANELQVPVSKIKVDSDRGGHSGSTSGFFTLVHRVYKPNTNIDCTHRRQVKNDMNTLIRLTKIRRKANSRNAK